MASPTPGLSRYSMILVGNSNAEYFYDPTTERLCVTLPYERPKGELWGEGGVAVLVVVGEWLGEHTVRP